jgi:YD repeat-containing protein
MRRTCARAILILSTILCGSTSHIAAAAETITYQYDVLGRLSATGISGGPTSGTQVATTFDAADNRTSQSTSGAPAITTTCTFAARDTQGGDEFTIHPYIERTGTCSGPVTVAYSVTYVSGAGGYGVYDGWNGNTFQPNDQYSFFRIIPYYGSVSQGDPLTLSVNWTIVSGTGVITRPQATVKIYNSDCYC